MGELDLFRIHQTWTDLREARVKDGFIFRVSRYFIDHWLRLLGPKAAWAVVDLQQRCYLSKRDSCQVSLRELCAATGVGSTTTMQSIVDEPLMGWFFAKQATRQRRAGKVMRGKNRYDLQMSDPLTPAHQGQVARLLVERLRDGTVEAVRGPADLLRLVGDLPPLSTAPAGELPAWATGEPLNLRQIALRALSQAGVTSAPASLGDETALRRAFAEAQAQITQPTRIALATHYFRTEWVPHLGATNAWLIMVLRSRCYWNKERGEVRDICVMSMQELAELLGTSARTAMRSLQDPLVGRFVTAQGRVYEPRESDGRRTPSRTRFQVLLTTDPLTPPDEVAFAEILLSDAARYGLDPTTGQMDMLDILEMMGRLTSDEISQRRGERGDKTEIRAAATGKSSDKIEIRERRRGAAVLGSGDRNGIRAAAERDRAAPETGSGDRIEIGEGASGPILAVPGGPEGEIEGESSDKSGFRASESSDKIDTAGDESGDRIEKQYSNTFINTEDDGERGQQQQYQAAAVPSPPSLPSLSPHLYEILAQYGIEEPTRSQIAASPQVTPELARAWMLYADRELGLTRKAGYVAQRLLKQPPDVPADPDLLLAASLTDEERAGFAQRRALEARMGAEVSFGDEGREARYQAWRRAYGRERDASDGDEDDGETAVAGDRGRAARWQPDVG